MSFARFIGIDYSGAGTADNRIEGLAVATASRGRKPVVTPPPDRPTGWTRRELARWLEERFRDSPPLLAAIDHGLSLPDSYFDRHGLPDWDRFLGHFAKRWPCDRPGVTVKACRRRNPPPPDRNKLRLCETWAPPAKSVFAFGIPGQVATSTHAGIPWIRNLRRSLGARLHVWPFDGWTPPSGVHVLVEGFPSLARQRYRPPPGTTHERDAWCLCRWLRDMAERNALERYFHPPLTPAEERRARTREGWILGAG